jgi:hypothetical protein
LIFFYFINPNAYGRQSEREAKAVVEEEEEEAMAKSMRSKKEKRLRAIRREIVEPFYDNKDAAKLAAQEAALAAPKLPARPSSTSTDTTTTTNAMGNLSLSLSLSLSAYYPVSGVQ